MSENLDLVRSIFEDWERGDYSRTDWAHPDIEYEHADGPAQGVWKGLAGMAEGWREWLNAWSDLRIAPEDYRELDEERVLVLSRGSAHGKTSGLDVDQMRSDAAVLFYIREGKVARLVVAWEREHALADLGLKE